MSAPEPVEATPEVQRVGSAVTVASTDGMDRADWLALRRCGIGGSDAAAISGMSRYSSPYMVWCEKVGIVDGDDETSEAAEWGNRLEPVVAEAVAEREGIELVDVRSLLSHPERPWQLANIDRLAITPDSEGVYEGKTAGHWSASGWDADSVPDAYMLQGMHYLAVTGLPWVLFGALLAGQRLVIRRVERDEGLIDHLTTIEAQFWKMVTDRTPPPPDGSKPTTALLNHLWQAKPGTVATVDRAEVQDVIALRATAVAQEKAAAEAKAEADNKIKALMGEAEILADEDGNKLATWKPVTAHRLDSKAHKESRPDCAAEFTKESTSRRLTIKGTA